MLGAIATYYRCKTFMANTNWSASIGEMYVFAQDEGTNEEEVKDIYETLLRMKRS